MDKAIKKKKSPADKGMQRDSNMKMNEKKEKMMPMGKKSKKK
jgi:hypothetical protein